jgi:Predicted membrane protein
MHFVVPGRYMGIMPPWIPLPLAMVYVSGVAEMLGGLGLLVPMVRRAAGIGLILLLIAVFPANVQMLANAVRGQASTLYITLLFLRLPLQPLLIVWVWRASQRRAELTTR